MRSLTKLTVVAFAGLTLGAAAVYAQTTSQAPSNCGMETWSTDKQTYVTVPCNGAGTAAPSQAQAPDAAKNTTSCGIETWSTDKQTYVTTPCVGGTTYENPGSTQ
jgi:hypothetical protein